jgi:hypothetical protein
VPDAFMLLSVRRPCTEKGMHACHMSCCFKASICCKAWGLVGCYVVVRRVAEV